MHVHIHPLRPSPNLPTIFREDGWTLEAEQNGDLRARHPQAPDESTARGRLFRLGLLTSCSLRIEFRFADRSTHCLQVQP
jgi:hypothetical protein